MLRDLALQIVVKISVVTVTDILTIICDTAGPSGRSPAEIVGSNPNGGMDVCLL